jgi:hypothetical protein
MAFGGGEMGKDRLMLGLWRIMVGVPSFLWRRQMLLEKKQAEAELGFMTPDHRRVHHYVVRELPRSGGPLGPDAVAEGLGLPLDRVSTILEDLERHMTFLVRNAEGRVTWAYPVTVDPTPHRITFSTGERLFAA